MDAKPRELQAHLLPWMSYPGTNYTDNVMLIGDAGGFPCPLEAEGIYPAMITGKIAAEVAVEAISEGNTSKNALKVYEDRWKVSSVGEEFQAGPELSHIWAKLPFSPKTNTHSIAKTYPHQISSFSTYAPYHKVHTANNQTFFPYCHREE